MNHSLHDLDISFKLYHKHFQDLDIVHFQVWCTILATWEVHKPGRDILCCLPSTDTWVEGGRQGRHL